MKAYFHLIVFFIITMLFCHTQSYLNKTVLVYNYGPLETCDPQDYWNQDKFGGLDFPILLSILNRTGWNRTEIAFMCIESYDDNLKAFAGGCSINHLFTFDDWFMIPIYIVANYSQPYHQLNFVVLASYKQPFWLFFERFDPLIFAIIVLVPLILSTLMHFIAQKEQKRTQLSDYFGLIFFQPEITGRRNISHKIVSFFFMFICLIISNYFTTMLQQELDDFKSFGGRSLDNGLDRVHVWAETVWIPRLMYTLVKPNDLESYYFDLPTWRTFAKQHSGENFLIISSMGTILSHEDCNLHLMGDFIYVTNILSITPIPRDQYMDLNAAILDVTKNPLYPYIPDYEVEDLMLKEDIKCKKIRKTGKQFQYTVKDFIVLWMIYVGATAAGLLLCSSFHFKKMYHRYKNVFYSETIINDRASYLARRIGSSVEISLFWLIIYQQNFVKPLCANKMRKVRAFFKETDRTKKIIRIKRSNKTSNANDTTHNIEWVNKIEQSRKKAIKHYLYMYKKIYIKIVLNTLLFMIKKQQNKFLVNMIKLNKPKKIIKKTKDKTYLAKLVNCSLKECLIKAMFLLKFSNAQPKSKVIKYIQKIGFKSRQRLKLKSFSKAHYKVNESFHTKMVDIFYSKIVCQIIVRVYKRNSYEKLIKHKDQVTRLIELNKKLPLRDLFVMLMDVIVFLRTDKTVKNKHNRLKRLPAAGAGALSNAKIFKTQHSLIKQQNLNEGFIHGDDIMDVEVKNLLKETPPIEISFQNMMNLNECNIQSAQLFIFNYNSNKVCIFIKKNQLAIVLFRKFYLPFG